jgi:hypothetical protein
MPARGVPKPFGRVAGCVRSWAGRADVAGMAVSVWRAALGWLAWLFPIVADEVAHESDELGQ